MNTTAVRMPKPIHVTDTDDDAPDGAVIVMEDGWEYERAGSTWRPRRRAAGSSGESGGKQQ